MRSLYIITWLMSISLLAGGVVAQEATPDTKPALSPKAQESFDFPNGRAGEIAEAFITTFNSGDESSVSDFLSTYANDARREELEKELWAYKRMFELLGTLSPYSVVASKDADLVLLVRSESIGSYFSVGITLDDGAPAMLDGHFIRPAAPPKG